jgi:hypothetical protein
MQGSSMKQSDEKHKELLLLRKTLPREVAAVVSNPTVYSFRVSECKWRTSQISSDSTFSFWKDDMKYKILIEIMSVRTNNKIPRSYSPK